MKKIILGMVMIIISLPFFIKTEVNEVECIVIYKNLDTMHVIPFDDSYTKHEVKNIKDCNVGDIVSLRIPNKY